MSAKLDGKSTALVVLGCVLVFSLFVYILYCRCRRTALGVSSTYEELEQLDDEEMRFKQIIESGGGNSDFNPFAQNGDSDTTIEDYSFGEGDDFNGDGEDNMGNIFELNSTEKNRLDQLENFRNNLMMASSNADTSFDGDSSQTGHNDDIRL
jgi:hypothetical protein